MVVHAYNSITGEAKAGESGGLFEASQCYAVRCCHKKKQQQHNNANNNNNM
jgi:hypothetical protein